MIQPTNVLHDKARSAIRARYRGNAISDLESYLLCRARIDCGFYPEHHLNLKRYYRRVFLNAPFRKGVVA